MGSTPIYDKFKPKTWVTSTCFSPRQMNKKVVSTNFATTNSWYGSGSPYRKDNRKNPRITYRQCGDKITNVENKILESFYFGKNINNTKYSLKKADSHEIGIQLIDKIRKYRVNC